MALVLGDILSGLVPLAQGAEQGIAKKRDLERQARQQLLAQRLQEAQIANYESETKARLQPRPSAGTWRLDSERGVLVNDVTGDIRVPPGLPPRAQTSTDIPDTQWNAWLATQPAPIQQKLRTLPIEARKSAVNSYVTGVVTPSEKPPKSTPQQLEKAEFGAGALAAWQPVEQERTTAPGVEEEVGRILASPTFLQAIPGFKGAADAARAVAVAGGSPAAQRYMRAKWSFMDNVIRTRIPGGRMSGALFTTMAGEFLPSLDPAANAQIRANEINAILSAQGESGYDQNPDVWNRAVKRHGVQNIDLQAALAGGSTDSRLNDIRRRYQ